MSKAVSKKTKLTLESAISTFGRTASEKLSNIAASGEPEDQLRAPFEVLLADLAELSGVGRDQVVAVGESSLSELKTRPDYAVTVSNALIGFIELKAPGKGADPRRFKGHDKEQWNRLQSLPNLIYSDGNQFSLWQDGELVGSIIRLEGDVESSGNELSAPAGLVGLFESFLRWNPKPPRNANDLARMSARLCRLLRDEVAEQLAAGSDALTALAKDWRKLLFPNATDERFADGYAQAVTFGLLMARAQDIQLATGMQKAAAELTKTNSLIGSALRLLTDNAENRATLKTSLGTLTRVLDVVNWKKISKGKPDAWLYFYEDFLEVYDNQLRKETGSYYTPPEVVNAMVRMVDELLRTRRFNKPLGLAAPTVTLADPAVGTGTFLLSVLRRIANTVAQDEGEGAIQGAVEMAMHRLIGFEMQLGPFAVAQLRMLAEIVELTGAPLKTTPQMFVTDTLGNPYVEEEWLPHLYEPIGLSRREANRIKREQPVTVVIGNPPYKEKAKGLGGWVEGQTPKEEKNAPLAEWMPPKDWKVSTHAKHLRNLYIYFWRWATWKVFDHHAEHRNGIVSFITVAGFLKGDGFQKMRDYLRRTCDDIWVIDCSPEGHQPEVTTRLFQGVQQPVCIVLASRSGGKAAETPARVLFYSLPTGHRTQKFEALGNLRLTGSVWVECPADWRAPFLPASTGAWASFPKIEDLFLYNGSGTMPGRTWIIAPDSDSLEKRWHMLVSAAEENKEKLFHPHLRDGEVGDKHSKKIVSKPLAGFPATSKCVAEETGNCLTPIAYGFRSFDRQWIIPDVRLINQANPELWEMRSERQVYFTVPSDQTPTNGPALSATAFVPDLHHYNGRGGRTFPLWRDSQATTSNFPPKLLSWLSERLEQNVNAEDFMAYLAALAAHPAYTARFQEDLSTPGLRLPLTADAALFTEAASLGREIIWLHTFGERFANADADRPSAPPRAESAHRSQIPKGGSIPIEPEDMPDSLSYDAATRRLHVGKGHIDNVAPEVWAYEVSGKQVLTQWFSYRKKNRERPLIGDRRPPSPLGQIQPDHWLPEYTTELINVLNVLTRLVALEPKQADLLERICTGPLISAEDLQNAGALDKTPTAKATKDDGMKDLFAGN